MHIVTDRLVLREFVIDDWPAVLAYQRDPRYLRFSSWANHTEAQVRDFVGMFVEQQVERPRRKFQFAITFPNDGRVIGNCGIWRKPGSYPKTRMFWASWFDNLTTNGKIREHWACRRMQLDRV